MPPANTLLLLQSFYSLRRRFRNLRFPRTGAWLLRNRRGLISLCTAN